MPKIYHLSTCKTCQKVIAALDNGEGFELQDIKFKKITPAQLNELKAISGSYESLFSRRAMKYRSLGLKEQTLTEEQYRDYILDEYTFLKRPAILIGEELFVGSSKKAIEGAKAALDKQKA